MTDVRALDTSVVVPLVVATHPDHAATKAWRGSRDCVVSGHALPEAYSVLTRLPVGLRVAPVDVVRVLGALFGEPITLSLSSAARLPGLLAEAGIAGGKVYDAMVGLAARDHGMVLATRDGRAKQTYEHLGVDVELVS